MPNYRVYRGDTIVLNITAKDTTGAALNLTGGTLTATLKSTMSDADPGLSQVTSPSSGITITNAAGGLATVTFPATATAGLTDDTTLYGDVQFVDSAGRKSTLELMTFEVKRDVTRA